MMHGYSEYGMGGGMWWFGGFFMILFWIIIIYLVVLLVKKSGREKESATDILKKRYARGEISREEFERMKEELKE